MGPRRLCGRRQQPIEVLPVRPGGSLLQLGVDVHRHPRVGVADLAHHPLHVELVGAQGDRDVGPAQAVRATGGIGGRPWAERRSVARSAACLTIVPTRSREIRLPVRLWTK